jgi:hypothetical protein
MIRFDRFDLIAGLIAVGLIAALLAFLPVPRHKMQRLEPAREIPVRALRDGAIGI